MIATALDGMVASMNRPELVQLALVIGCVGLAAYALFSGQVVFASMMGGGLLGALNPTKGANAPQPQGT